MSAELVRQGRRIAELLGDPTITGDQRRALVAMEAEVARSAEEAAIAAQRAQRIAEANAAAEAGAERVRAHPATHAGPCPANSGGWISRAEMGHGSGAIWHVDADQPPPSWWPRTGMVLAPPTPAELSAQRARREVELKAAEAAERVSARIVR